MARPKTKPGRLSDLARHLVEPDGIVSTGWPAVRDQCAEFGDTFDEWQDGAGRLILAKRADGLYAATIGGVTLSIPRQVAKTFLVGRIIFALCVLFPNTKVLWTAHRTRTATNTFRSLQGFARRKKVAPYIKHIRTANGEQEIAFRNGSVIMFGAREQGFGRGFDEVDIEVFDEAQILTEKALEDMVAATNQARHPHGALLFYMGTPPRPTDPGEAFTLRRNKALASDGVAPVRRVGGDMVYVEFSADEEADLDDHDQWAKANPSYPHRTPLESMLRLRENLPSDDAWRREALGIWDRFNEYDDRPIPIGPWNDLEIPDSEVPAGTPDRYALTMSPERVASIAVAVKGEVADYVDLAELARVDDSRMLVDWLVKRAGRRIPVMIDSRDPAASFVNELRARGVKVNTTTQSDAGRACGGLLDAVTEGRVWHCGQPAIRTALAVVQRREIGKAGLWEFALDDPLPEISALRALTLAHYGLSFTKNSKSTSVGRRVVTG